MKKTIEQLSRQVAEKISEDNYSQIARELWWILIKQKQYGHMDLLLDEIDEKISSQNNQTKVKIISVSKLDENQKNQICEKLEKKFDSKINVDYEEDPKLLGGFKIISKDSVYDYSYSAKLKQLKHKLVGKNE